MKKKQLFVRSIESFREDGTPEHKIEYNLDGEEVRVIEYNKQGQPLSGACGDSVSWRMVDDHTILIEGCCETDDYSPQNLPPWHMHEITSVEVGEGVTGIGARAFSTTLTKARVCHLSTPESFMDTIESMLLWNDDWIASLTNKEGK